MDRRPRQRGVAGRARRPVRRAAAGARGRDPQHRLDPRPHAPGLGAAVGPGGGDRHDRRVAPRRARRLARADRPPRRHAPRGGRGLTALLDEVRSACARVAARAQHVRIVDAAIEHYARTLPPQAPPSPDIEDASLEARAAFSLTLNAINFGSAWFPTLRKPSGLSGFRTIEAGLRARGPWTAAELATIQTREVAETFGQDPEHELMGLFTRALRELGDRITVEYFGCFLGLVNSAEGSAERLAETLATWPTWRGGPGAARPGGGGSPRAAAPT